MMAINQIYWLLTLLCCGYCLIWGDRIGRLGGLITIGVALASGVATWPGTSWARTDLPLILVDGLYLIALVALALRSDRYWPIWLAGFQLDSVIALFGPFFLSGLPARLVEGLESFWAIPILSTMCVGVEQDRRARLSVSKGVVNDPFYTHEAGSR